MAHKRMINGGNDRLYPARALERTKSELLTLVTGKKVSAEENSTHTHRSQLSQDSKQQ